MKVQRSAASMANTMDTRHGHGFSLSTTIITPRWSMVGHDIHPKILTFSCRFIQLSQSCRKYRHLCLMITSQFLMAKSNSQLNIGGQPFLDQFSQEICTTQFHTTAERLPAVVHPTLSTSAQSAESCPPEICEVTTIG